LAQELFQAADRANAALVVAGPDTNPRRVNAGLKGDGSLGLLPRDVVTPTQRANGPAAPGFAACVALKLLVIAANGPFFPAQGQLVADVVCQINPRFLVGPCRFREFIGQEGD